ncbi:MAG: OmpA family protein, partial [Pseudomonadota bacterium]
AAPFKAPTLAAGAVVPLPRGAQTTAVAGDVPAPIINAVEERQPVEMTAVAQSKLQNTLAEFLKERDSWGTAPSERSSAQQGATKVVTAVGKAVADSLSVGGFPALTTLGVDELLKQRDQWGTGSVDASETAKRPPLAAGAQFPLPRDESELAAVAGAAVAKTIVNAAEERAQFKLSSISSRVLQGELVALLAERDSWGAQPSSVSIGGYPVLTTRGVDALLAQRDKWGAGVDKPAKRPPLAVGAQFPLPKDADVPGDGAAAQSVAPIIHAAEERDDVKLTAVAMATINKELSELLKTRDSWGDRPSAVGRDYEVLPTDSVDSVLAARAVWGEGPKVEPKRPPLAAGAVSPLPMDTREVVVVSREKPTINNYVPRPVPTMSAVPAKKINAELDALLAERASWGETPSLTSKQAVLRYPNLTTASVDDLLAQRATWGMAEAKAIAAPPLAAGGLEALQKALRPSGQSTASAASVAAPIINAPEERPVVKLDRQPARQVDLALEALLAERDGWLRAAAKSTPDRYAVLPTSTLEDLLAKRDTWTASAPEKSANTGGNQVSAKPAEAVRGAKSTEAGSVSDQQGAAANRNAPVTETKVAAAAFTLSKPPVEVAACQGEIQQIAADRAVRFRSGRADLTRDSRATLRAIARVINRCDDASKIEIGGHTDSSGSDEVNLELSQARAQSVAAYLKRNGVSGDRLEARGYGESQPIAPNDSWANKSLNRRIEFNLH